MFRTRQQEADRRHRQAFSLPPSLPHNPQLLEKHNSRQAFLFPAWLRQGKAGSRHSSSNLGRRDRELLPYHQILSMAWPCMLLPSAFGSAFHSASSSFHLFRRNRAWHFQTAHSPHPAPNPDMQVHEKWSHLPPRLFACDRLLRGGGGQEQGSLCLPACHLPCLSAHLLQALPLAAYHTQKTEHGSEADRAHGHTFHTWEEDMAWKRTSSACFACRHFPTLLFS